LLVNFFASYIFFFKNGAINADKRKNDIK